MDVYVQTWPKRKGHCYYFYKLSSTAADVIRLGIFSKTSAEWCIFFWKMQQYFFSWSPVPPQMGRKHLEEIFSGFLEGLADSTMELIDSRCEGTQWNSEAFFCLSL